MEKARLAVVADMLNVFHSIITNSIMIDTTQKPRFQLF